MENVYSAPKSNLEDQYRREREILDLLKKEQSIVGVVLGSILGVVPAILFEIMVFDQTFIAMIFTIVPGVVVGYMARFTGRPFQLWLRFIPAVITCIPLGLLFYLVGVNPFFYLLLAPNAVAAIVISKRALDFDQEKALYLVRLGKMEL